MKAKDNANQQRLQSMKKQLASKEVAMIQGFKDVLMGSKKNPYMDEDKQQEELEQETINIKEKISRNLEHLKAIDASPTFIRIGEEQSVQDRIQFVEDHLRN